MSRRKQKRLTGLARGLSVLGAALRCRIQSLRVSGRRRQQVRLEVLVADDRSRRTLESEVRKGLRRLERALGNTLPAPEHLAIVVQRVVKTDRQLAGCYQVGGRPDGSRFALIRLALEVNGQRLGVDYLLAALAEQYVGLVTQQSGSPSVLVPLELEPTPAAEASPRTTLRPDPLTAHPSSNGRPPLSRSQVA